MHIPSALKRTLKTRRSMMESGKADWAMGEAFAFGSLLQDGKVVRLSGKGSSQQMVFGQEPGIVTSM